MSGFVKILLININISAVFCWSLVSGYYIRFDLRRGALAAGSLASSSAGSLVGSLAGSLISSLVSSLISSPASSLVGLGCKYGFTVMVLKLIGPFISCTLYISPSILSNLYRPVHLPLYLVLPLYHISMSKLKRRSWIVVTDRPFCWFNVLLIYFFALIFAISSIAFFIATAHYIVNNTDGLSLLIQG